MYNILSGILSDKKGGEIFTVFGLPHFGYIALTICLIVIVLMLMRGKKISAKLKATSIFLSIAFGIYITDFFLMPLAYGEIDIEKLPFHVCTAMCVMCFLSYRITFLKKYRLSFVLLGFISNLVYLIYPAGVMWHAVHPLSYRVIQNLLFHSLMTTYGFLTLIYEREKFNAKNCYRDLAVVVGMTVWALIGNYVYNGESEGYSHFFNWFFVVRDPFYIFDKNIAQFIMPFLVIALFFVVELVIHLILWCVGQAKKLRQKNQT